EIIADTLKQITVVGNAESTPQSDMTAQVVKLLEALSDETLSASEIMKRLGLSHRPTFRKNYL
ncbi:MAG TPA: cell filamentation protein Fic, partial [Clostridiaceae bacterium]|nr:cell filamentation protein Fic [Clostridiaceae bacterium]